MTVSVGPPERVAARSSSTAFRKPSRRSSSSAVPDEAAESAPSRSARCQFGSR
ncbi:MAG: hypothetical protein U0326_30040 [Polyangiales bacterium]